MKEKVLDRITEEISEAAVTINLLRDLIAGRKEYISIPRSHLGFEPAPH
jgi:hypothetical protein